VLESGERESVGVPTGLSVIGWKSETKLHQIRKVQGTVIVKTGTCVNGHTGNVRDRHVLIGVSAPTWC